MSSREILRRLSTWSNGKVMGKNKKKWNTKIINARAAHLYQGVRCIWKRDNGFSAHGQHEWNKDIHILYLLMIDQLGLFNVRKTPQIQHDIASDYGLETVVLLASSKLSAIRLKSSSQQCAIGIPSQHKWNRCLKNRTMRGSKLSIGKHVLLKHNPKMGFSRNNFWYMHGANYATWSWIFTAGSLPAHRWNREYHFFASIWQLRAQPSVH